MSAFRRKAMGAIFMQLEFLERPLKYREAGSPAGSWPHTPWWVCVLYDQYERINVWSHGLPGLALIAIGILAYYGSIPGGAALALFCACSAVTHTSSAITHIWPDSHILEKIDHLSIPFTLIGTPLSAIMVVRPDGPYLPLAIAAAALVVAAMCAPLARTLLFVGTGALLAVQYHWLFNAYLAINCFVHVLGAIAFVRNGGHERPMGLQDHHFLHYFVTIGSAVHILYILEAWNLRQIR